MHRCSPLFPRGGVTRIHLAEVGGRARGENALSSHISRGSPGLHRLRRQEQNLPRIGSTSFPLFDYPLDQTLSTLSQGFGDGLGESSRGASWSPVNSPGRSTAPPASSCWPSQRGRPRPARPCRSLRLPWWGRVGTRNRPVRDRRQRATVARPSHRPQIRVEQGFHPHDDTKGPPRSRRRVWIRRGAGERHPVEPDHRTRLGAPPGRPPPRSIRPRLPDGGGILRLRASVALAGYVLRRWSVDYSLDHPLSGPEYWLCLLDALAPYGVESTALAPGYVPTVDRG